MYIRPIVSKALLSSLMANFSRIKEKSLRTRLLVTVVQKYFRREYTSE